MSDDYSITDALSDMAVELRIAASRASKSLAKVMMRSDVAIVIAQRCDFARQCIEELQASVGYLKQAKENAERSNGLLQDQIDELRASNARLKTELEEGQMTALAMAAFVAGRLSK